MVKIISYLLFLSVVLSSCQYFDSFTQKKFNRIDFTTVDKYPLFPSCDSLATLEYQKKCFEQTASELIQAELEVNQIISPIPVSNAIIVHFDVDRNGKASLYELENFNKIKPYLPELEDVIRQSIENFPTLVPAKKRNLSVSSRYMVPIYIVD